MDANTSLHGHVALRVGQQQYHGNWSMHQINHLHGQVQFHSYVAAIIVTMCNCGIQCTAYEDQKELLPASPLLHQDTQLDRLPLLAFRHPAMQHLYDHLPFHPGRGGDSHGNHRLEGHMANVILQHLSDHLPLHSGGDWDSLGNHKPVLHVDSLSLNFPREQRQELLARRPSPDQEHQHHTRLVLLDHIILHKDLLHHGQDYERNQLARYEESLLEQANSNLQVNVTANITSQSAVSYLRPTCPSQLLSWHFQLGTSITPEFLHEFHIPLVHRGHIRPRHDIHTLWAIFFSLAHLPQALGDDYQEIAVLPYHHVQDSMLVVSVLLGVPQLDTCKHEDQHVLHRVPHSKVQHAGPVRVPHSQRIRIVSCLPHTQRGHDLCHQHYLQVTEVTMYIRPQAAFTYLSRLHVLVQDGQFLAPLRVCLAITTCNIILLLPFNFLPPACFAGMADILTNHAPEHSAMNHNGLGPLHARQDCLQHPHG